MKRLLSNWLPLALLTVLAVPASLQGQEGAARGQAAQTPAGRAQAGRAQAGRGAEAAPPPAQVEEPELVFEREMFRYPNIARRNPFKPLVGDASGPRFEQMELRGVVYSTDQRQSVALLGLRGKFAQRLQQRVQQQTAAAEAGTLPPQVDTILVPDPSTRLKVGQSWGNVRVVQIARDNVVLDVTDFGLTERRTLTMTLVRRQGGQP